MQGRHLFAAHDGKRVRAVQLEALVENVRELFTAELGQHAAAELRPVEQALPGRLAQRVGLAAHAHGKAEVLRRVRYGVLAHAWRVAVPRRGLVCDRHDAQLPDRAAQPEALAGELLVVRAHLVERAEADAVAVAELVLHCSCSFHWCGYITKAGEPKGQPAVVRYVVRGKQKMPPSKMQTALCKRETLFRRNLILML